MKLYTKTGDKGKTSLFGGQRVPKNNIRIETYGTVDELNSVIGLARSFNKHEELDNLFQSLQNTLFNLGADLATPFGSKFEDQVKRIKEDHISYLEKEIDRMQEKSPEFKNFILPGGGHTASYLHLARTVCRRAERSAIALAEVENIGEFSIKYLNRLSDFFFICARYSNVLDGQNDIEWSTK
jgi:cob(I)alamin adenosyltransferase